MALWWSFLVIVSALNIALLIGLRAVYRANPFDAANAIFAAEPLALLSVVYVFGCAFRPLLPRADVERICLFNTWLSSMLIGRSIATLGGALFRHSMGHHSARTRPRRAFRHVAVWASRLLGSLSPIRHLLPLYRMRRPLFKPAERRLVPVAIRSSR